MKQNISMKISYLINEHLKNQTIESLLNSFHLGKTKRQEFKNNLSVNGHKASFETILRLHDVLEIEYHEQIDFILDRKKLDVVYEDDYLLLVNKPRNILVHPDDKAKQGTMCNIVSYYYHNKKIELSVKYAHRLDMDTTGILIFVKDALTHAKINDMILTHELVRNYLCLVSGKMKQKSGWIDAPIGMDRHHQQRRRISKTGKPAQTFYEVIQEYKDYTLLKVRLKTGRTHQIRVHLSSIGHPIIGDRLYGGRDANRLMLHSYEVDFVHPITQKRIVLQQKLPYDMAKYVERRD